MTGYQCEEKEGKQVVSGGGWLLRVVGGGWLVVGGGWLVVVAGGGWSVVGGGWLVGRNGFGFARLGESLEKRFQFVLGHVVVSVSDRRIGSEIAA